MTPRIIALGLVALAACTTPPSEPHETPPATVEEVARKSHDDPETLEIEDPNVAKFVAELQLTEQENRAASRAELALAKKKLETLDFQAARRALNRALAHDPSNAQALRLQERLLFALGERSGTIALVSEDLADGERVRKEQSKIELKRLYNEADALMKAEKFDEAAAAYHRLLIKLELEQQ